MLWRVLSVNNRTPSLTLSLSPSFTSYHCEIIKEKKTLCGRWYKSVKWVVIMSLLQCYLMMLVALRIMHVKITFTQTCKNTNIQAHTHTALTLQMFFGWTAQWHTFPQLIMRWIDTKRKKRRLQSKRYLCFFIHNPFLIWSDKRQNINKVETVITCRLIQRNITSKLKEGTLCSFVISDVSGAFVAAAAVTVAVRVVSFVWW